jgi:hypothetical protein
MRVFQAGSTFRIFCWHKSRKFNMASFSIMFVWCSSTGSETWKQKDPIWVTTSALSRTGTNVLSSGSPGPAPRPYLKPCFADTHITTTYADTLVTCFAPRCGAFWYFESYQCNIRILLNPDSWVDFIRQDKGVRQNQIGCQVWMKTLSWSDDFIYPLEILVNPGVKSGVLRSALDSRWHYSDDCVPVVCSWLLHHGSTGIALKNELVLIR